MSLQRVPVGRDVPNDINVIIEIPMHSPAVKYEVDNAEDSHALSLQLRLHPAYALWRRRSHRRHGRDACTHQLWRGRDLPPGRTAADGG